MADTKGVTHAPPTSKAKPKSESIEQPGRIKGGASKAAAVHIKQRSLKSARDVGPGGKHFQVIYVRSKGVDDFVTKVYEADPIRLIETERMGVAGVFVKDLSKRMHIPAQRMFTMLGVPKATAEKKVSSGELLSGSGGRAALGMARLLGIAHEIVEGSTAPEARNFDSAKWLGEWLEKPQPALGGRKPASLIDTPTGVEVVAKLLGAIESGAYL